MILISYDGSLDGQAAIGRAAELMPGAQATVLTVWRPFVEVMRYGPPAGIGVGLAGMYENDPKIDDASRHAALATATEGAERATAEGLLGTPRIACRGGGVAATILAEASELAADAIVLGTRGLSGVRSFMLGSVSHAVVQHADRAVLVVPSSIVAEQRHGWGQPAEPVAAAG